MMTLHSRQKSVAGFTLIELLVTIAIIGTLAAILVTNLVGARARAADAKKKAELQQLKSALRLYYNDFQSYPSGAGLINTNLGSLGPGAEFSMGSTVYMKALPESYSYFSASPYEHFVMYTPLGNLSDDSLQTNYDHCGCPATANCPVTLTNEFVVCDD